MQDAKSDEQLLEAFVNGDTRALGRLAERFERPMLGLACGLLGGDAADACDAVQQAWLRVIRYASSFNSASGVKTWIYRIAINDCKHIAAARQRFVRIIRSGASEQHASSPVEASHDKERTRRLRDAVAQLSSDKRLVLLLCYHQGITHEQAAEVLDVPVGTLKSRLHAALEELRRVLPPEVE